MGKIIMKDDLPLTKEFHIEFDTKDMAPYLLATRITIEQVILRDMKKPVRIDLCTHPLYPKLVDYVLANPPAHLKFTKVEKRT